MSRLWMSGAAAVMALSLAGVQASQDPQPQPQPQPQTPQTQAAAPAASDNQATTTLRGCVYKEKDIPGRSPNVAEQAGVLEDYILVASHHSAGSASDTAATGTTGTSGTATGTAGTSGTMSAHSDAKAFKLEKIADEQLSAVVGKMVEVTGKIDAERGDSAAGAAGTAGTAGAPAQDRSLGPDQIELPEFEVTSIREVEGTCPATPDIKK